MTYDPRAQLAAFHAEKNLTYPLLQDLDARHMRAYGILNDHYAPGEDHYGIPHPGVIYADGAGTVVFKFADPGFRERPSFDAIHAALEALGGD